MNNSEMLDEDNGLFEDYGDHIWFDEEPKEMDQFDIENPKFEGFLEDLELEGEINYGQR